MTLNKDGLEAAHAAYAKTTGGLLEGHPMANAIRAYLSAVALSDELEVVAWRHTLHMEHGQKAISVDLEEEHPYGESGEDFDPSYTVTSEPLVRADQAQSTITALRARIDELEAAVDAEEKPHGMPWRFWSDKSRELANKLYDANTRAETAEQQIRDMRAALRKIEGDLQSSIDTHEFNARHMIAEDSLQDAWKMLDLAREQFQVDANALRIPLATARLLLKEGGADE
jgi:hypothetical protein